MLRSSVVPTVPQGWEWVLDIVDEAHLPHLGLPVKWDATKEKHQRIAFDPEKNVSIDLDSGKKTKTKESPVGFIKATKGTSLVPATKEPASVRVARYMEPCLHDSIIEDASGSTLAPCIGCGDYVKVASLAADHLQAKSNIIQRQKELVEKLNEDQDFADFLLQQPGMSKFFVKVQESSGDVYYGTLFFYEIYFNDIDNIWLICQACNSQKSDDDALEWFKKQWLYGPGFLDYLGKCRGKKDSEVILLKVRNREGLAKVAIDWFWDRHANYISIAQRLQENIITPIEILNKKVDHVIGLENRIRAERLEASLDARMLLTESIAAASGLGMPKRTDESSHSSSDDASRITPMKDKAGNELVVTPNTYRKAAQETSSEIGVMAKESLKKNIIKLTEEKTSSQKTTRRKGKK
jgi:hypothetical protein